jgi:hypothetical protein
MDSANPRGALWTRWDPHIHAPGTILSDLYRGSDPWEEFLSRIEASDPLIRALGITDYCSVAVYEQVLEKQRNGRLTDVGLIFPNIEMRFGIETAKGSAINVHLLFSPEDPNHVVLIKRFLSELHFPFEGETYRCDRDDLIRLGKAYDKSIRDDRKALEVGSTQFKVDFNELRAAWKDSAWVQHNTLVAVAGGTGDGTAGLKENTSFAALRREIERFAHIIFLPTDSKGSSGLERAPTLFNSSRKNGVAASRASTDRTPTGMKRLAIRTSTVSAGSKET